MAYHRLLRLNLHVRPAAQLGLNQVLRSVHTSSATYWDISYAPHGTVDSENTRFLRLHAAPSGIAISSPGTVVIIHGGYWKNKFGLDDPHGNAGTVSMAPFFLRMNFTVVELEYRRSDHKGGGWPGTNEDILHAIRRIAQFHAEAVGGEEEAGIEPACIDAARALRPDKLILFGHSAGGCLALWAAHQLAANVIPRCRVALTIAMAPVADLVHGHELRVSDNGDAVELYMKCRPDTENGLKEYMRASPAALLPATFPLLVVHGDNDKHVPPELISRYAGDAKRSAPELVTELVVAGADHFEIVNAASEAWNSYIVPVLTEKIRAHVHT